MFHIGDKLIEARETRRIAQIARLIDEDGRHREMRHLILHAQFVERQQRRVRFEKFLRRQIDVDSCYALKFAHVLHNLCKRVLPLT